VGPSTLLRPIEATNGGDGFLPWPGGSSVSRRDQFRPGATCGGSGRRRSGWPGPRSDRLTHPGAVDRVAWAAGVAPARRVVGLVAW